MHEPAKLRYRPHFAAPLLRIRAEQGFSNNLFSLAARLVQAENVGRAYLVLPLAAMLIGIALIVGLSTRLANLQQKTAL